MRELETNNFPLIFLYSPNCYTTLIINRPQNDNNNIESKKTQRANIKCLQLRRINHHLAVPLQNSLLITSDDDKTVANHHHH